ncbi:MAG: DegQ family serine endoprotease [Deltaproteobacteria bacterium]|nr:DegQ family serine endoprotease [Deltaproteobacteria bacterium]
MTKGLLRSMPIQAVAIFGTVLLCGISAVNALASAPAVLEQMDNAFVQVAEKVTPAVVNISSTKKEEQGPGGPDLEQFFKNFPPFRDFHGDESFKKFKKGPGQGGGFRHQGMGSGVIVSADGVILTNSHVVKDADEIKVNLSDKRSYDAKVIGADPESDIAVIKIDAKGLPTAQLGDSSKLRVGEIVMAIGNPFGLNRTVTSGIISATGRTNVGIIDYEDFLQTDAAINPGNSGGPLVNIRGEVIGINTAIASRSGGYQGIGFAIPSNSAKLIMDDLIKDGKVRRGLLGVNIQDLNESLAKSFGRNSSDGALVSQVIDGSPAEKAGIKAGDIIVKFNSEPVQGAAQLKNMVGKEKPGTSVKLTVFRDKKTFDVTVNISERSPRTLASGKSSPESQTSNELGIDIEPVPPVMAEKMGLKEGEGLRVKDISEDGAGSRMGIKSGDVILEVDGVPVSESSSFNKALAEAKKNQVIRLKVQRNNQKIFLAAPLS